MNRQDFLAAKALEEGKQMSFDRVDEGGYMVFDFFSGPSNYKVWVKKEERTESW